MAFGMTLPIVGRGPVTCSARLPTVARGLVPRSAWFSKIFNKPDMATQNNAPWASEYVATSYESPLQPRQHAASTCEGQKAEEN